MVSNKNIHGNNFYSYIPAGYNISESDPQMSSHEQQMNSHELQSSSHDTQTLSQEITVSETLTVVTREFLHFLGKC